MGQLKGHRFRTWGMGMDIKIPKEMVEDDIYFGRDGAAWKDDSIEVEFRHLDNPQLEGPKDDDSICPPDRPR